MADEPTDISPEDKAALKWLGAQPGGAVKMSAAEFGRNVGWNRQKAVRRLDAMTKSGLVVRRAGVITLNKERTIVRTEIIRELDDRFHESCHNLGIHLDSSGSYIGPVQRNWG